MTVSTEHHRLLSTTTLALVLEPRIMFDAAAAATAADAAADTAAQDAAGDGIAAAAADEAASDAETEGLLEAAAEAGAPAADAEVPNRAFGSLPAASSPSETVPPHVKPHS